MELRSRAMRTVAADDASVLEKMGGQNESLEKQPRAYFRDEDIFPVSMDV